jgi:hypothetical protein
MQDMHEPGKRRTDATIRATDIEVYSDDPFLLGDNKSRLTWGYADSDMAAGLIPKPILARASKLTYLPTTALVH